MTADNSPAAGLRRLEDDREIRDLLARLAHLADRGSLEDYLALWAPDGVWEGSEDAARGHDALRARVESYRERGIQGPGSGARHLVTTQYVELAGDRAHAASYFLYLTGAPAAPRVARVGRYADDLVRLGPGWRLAHRRIVLDD